MDPAARYLTAAYLVTWSATTISAESASHLSMISRLARTEEVRNTAPAQARVLGVPADFLPVVPAALALGMRAWIDPDANVWQRGTHYVLRRAVLHPRLRSDEYEPQVVGERPQEAAALPVRIELDLALQGGPDLPRHAQRFELLEHVRAQFAQLRPALTQPVRIARQPELIPGLLEHARRAVRQHLPRLLRRE